LFFVPLEKFVNPKIILLMKNRYTAGFLGLFLVCCIVTNAQEPIPVKQHITDKPFLFSQLPDRSDCITEELIQLFQAAPSSSIAIHLPGNLVLRGVITEKLQRSPGITSINIKLSNYPGALFNISLNTETGSTAKIKGRIIHPQSGDVLILTEDHSTYYLKKQLQKFFMTE